MGRAVHTCLTAVQTPAVLMYTLDLTEHGKLAEYRLGLVVEYLVCFGTNVKRRMENLLASPSDHFSTSRLIESPHVIKPVLLVVVGLLAGCGTTKWSDTSRTATEQLVLSEAIDNAVSEIDFTVLNRRKVFFDPQYVEASVDKKYLVSSMRQHLLACGCLLEDNRDKAEFVIEARTGAVGTNRHDLLFGVPQVNIPSVIPVPGMPSQIPEIPLAKKTKQIGVVKLGVFAYERETGQRVWQSGLVQQGSEAKDVWLFGAGPIQRGPMRNGTAFAGMKLRVPLLHRWRNGEAQNLPSVSREVVYSAKIRSDLVVNSDAQSSDNSPVETLSDSPLQEPPEVKQASNSDASNAR